MLSFATRPRIPIGYVWSCDQELAAISPIVFSLVDQGPHTLVISPIYTIIKARKYAIAGRKLSLVFVSFCCLISLSAL